MNEDSTKVKLRRSNTFDSVSSPRDEQHFTLTPQNLSRFAFMYLLNMKYIYRLVVVI